jgi:hypothetical protein
MLEERRGNSFLIVAHVRLPFVTSNATLQAPPIAYARTSLRLSAVACKRLLGREVLHAVAPPPGPAPPPPMVAHLRGTRNDRKRHSTPISFLVSDGWAFQALTRQYDLFCLMLETNSLKCYSALTFIRLHQQPWTFPVLVIRGLFVSDRELTFLQT